MRRRSALPLLSLVSLLASLAIASTVAAGNWALVSVADLPFDPVAGTDTEIRLTVEQHGETPVSWPSLTVVATEQASRAVFRTDAVAKGPTGAYVATLVFPAEGSWSLSFESRDLLMEGAALLQVAPALGAAPVAPAAQAPAGAPAAAVGTPGPGPAGVDGSLLAVLGIALALGTLVVVVRLARHGRRSDGQVDGVVSARG